MTRMPDATTTRPAAASLRHFLVITLSVLLAMFAGSTASFAQQASVGLGTADSFAVLAGTTITNTGPTTITGDVGLHPGSAVTGFDDVTLSGELHLADAVAEQAKVDLVTAYGDAAGRLPVTSVAAELGGQTLQGGVYGAGTFGLTGTLTLDAAGDPNTVWVFQAASTLTTASNSSVNLINGADACNVFWQVGSSATLGTGTEFVGNILALESITLTTGATVQGRVLARNGAVTLDTNTITNAACTTPAADDDAPVDETPVDETPVDETPVDETPVDETPVDEAPGDGAPDDGALDDGGTTGQIEEVPGGAVAAGGGDADAGISGSPLLLVAVLILLTVGGTMGVIARRRTRA